MSCAITKRLNSQATVHMCVLERVTSVPHVGQSGNRRRTGDELESNSNALIL